MAQCVSTGAKIYLNEKMIWGLWALKGLFVLQTFYETMTREAKKRKSQLYIVYNYMYIHREPIHAVCLFMFEIEGNVWEY